MISVSRSGLRRPVSLMEISSLMLNLALYCTRP
jgi:hypothetical protein